MARLDPLHHRSWACHHLAHAKDKKSRTWLVCIWHYGQVKHESPKKRSLHALLSGCYAWIKNSLKTLQFPFHGLLQTSSEPGQCHSSESFSAERKSWCKLSSPCQLGLITSTDFQNSHQNHQPKCRVGSHSKPFVNLDESTSPSQWILLFWSSKPDWSFLGVARVLGN